jgi:membrane-bound lytic murein transglycosylase D
MEKHLSMNARLQRFFVLRLTHLALSALVCLSGCVSSPHQNTANQESETIAPYTKPLMGPSTALAPKITEIQSLAVSTPVSDTQAATPITPITPIDPLRPEEKINLNAPGTEADLWARIRRGFGMPLLTGELVENKEQWYASRPQYIERMTSRGSRYLFHVVEEVERRGMPTELALLPFIESAFNPQAVSSAKASGMWQFMPATGKFFELRQNIFRDDRRDVLASTRAALDYLAKLHGMFGDWHLALAAYNWGEGSVQRAIARNRKAGLPTDYPSLNMPQETQQYVPKLQAVKNILANPQAYGVALAPLANHPYFLSVPIERDLDVALAIELAGVDREEFMTLNPQMNKPVILAAGTPQVLLPYANASQFIANLQRHRGPLSSWTAWVAPRTLKLREVAQQVGMPELQLRQINAIAPSMMIKAGSTLLVSRNGQRQQDVSEHLADHATMSLTPEPPPLQRVILKAQRKDSVATLARRYRLSAAQVAQWNHTSPQARLKPGQSLVAFVSARQAHQLAAKARPTGRASRQLGHRQTRIQPQIMGPMPSKSSRESFAKKRGARAHLVASRSSKPSKSKLTTSTKLSKHHR